MALINRTIPRIVQNLNYRRTFLARDCLRIDVPGLPYEAFDKDAKVKPRNLLYLFESMWALAFWNQSRNSNIKYQTLLDLGAVMENHITFALGINTTIERSFHEFDVPKCPLHVIAKLKYLGKSSKTISYKLYNSNSETLFVTCDITDVLVSLTSRKPVSYPDWWLQKYGDLMTADKAKLMPETTDNCRPIESKVRVALSDTDFNLHTKWIEYMKFCHDCLTEQVIEGSYENIHHENLNSGIKSFNLVYKKESNLGDVLTVRSWESPTKQDTVTFDVLKERESCMHCNITLYPPRE